MTGYLGCIYPEDLYFDSVPLQHVDSLSDVGPGTWFFDYSGQTIYFYDDPSGHTVETSVTALRRSLRARPTTSRFKA